MYIRMARHISGEIERVPNIASIEETERHIYIYIYKRLFIVCGVISLALCLGFVEKVVHQGPEVQRPQFVSEVRYPIAYLLLTMSQQSGLTTSL